MTDHPEWCDVATSCDASGNIGAHRSKPIKIDGYALNLYSDAIAPDTPLVELHCGASTLDPRSAYALGRMLSTLGRRANGNGRPT
jgi:hypothetical protein